MCVKREQQMTFAASDSARFARSNKRAKFLSEMDHVVPWERLCAIVEPRYPTGEGGRSAIPLERMLRIYFLQQVVQPWRPYG
jgi:IS5 family transposase